MDEIIDLLQSLMQQAADLSDELSDEEMSKILKIFQDAIEAIGQPQVETPLPELEGAPHPSSNINAFQYDPKSGKLLVKFMGKDVANAGPTYAYEGVPPFIFDIFKRGAVGPKTSGSNKWHAWKKGVTPSHGAAMYALIKAGGFPYQKVA